MPPRFMERMKRQSETLQAVFGPEPPSYSSTRSSRTESNASSTWSSAQSPPPVYARSSSIPHFLDQGDLGRRSEVSYGIDKLAIPRGSLILVIGANSWLGTHVVDQLLEQGYRVRGTVRSAEKGAWGTNYFTKKYGEGQYNVIQVPDMAVQNAFDVAVRDCCGIIHLASDTTMSPDPNEVITPSIAGAINALESATKDANIVRFVLCSSVSAAVSHSRGIRNEITSESWNMLDFEDAWASPPYEQPRAVSVAASSKMQTEAAVWRWFAQKRPYFSINTVLPDTLVGAVLDDRQTLPASTKLLKSLYQGRNFAHPPSYAVDVQDAAILHVAALILSDVAQQRIFAAPMPYNIELLTQILQNLYPGKEIGGNIPRGGVDLTVFKEVPRAEELLRRMGRKGWRDLEDSVQKACQGLI